MLNAVTYRHDIWPSRQAAAKNFAKSPIFASWDKRVLERMVRYGLRDLPTALDPDESSENGNPDSRVTLTTTKHQEVWTLIRPNYSSRDASGHIKIDRSTHADIDPFAAFMVETAQECAHWLGAEMARFHNEEEKWRRVRLTKPTMDDIMMNAAFMNVVKPPTMARTHAPKVTKL